ncbi:alkaline phosphatase D family protein [Hyphomicrobium sp.]|uniref:alkaline phosphatase D family protein n=1 Tax=Hyphomicrobium sp. TaxID=82 RepID=UPI003422C5B9|nr:alkaline phosphatase D family protein [Hyphomicrobium sp.]
MWSYADGPTATDLIGYRDCHALYRTDPDLQTLYAAAPCLVTWHDHEVENDYANEWSQDVAVSSDAVGTCSVVACHSRPDRATALIPLRLATLSVRRAAARNRPTL